MEKNLSGLHYSYRNRRYNKKETDLIENMDSISGTSYNIKYARLGRRYAALMVDAVIFLISMGMLRELPLIN